MGPMALQGPCLAGLPPPLRARPSVVKQRAPQGLKVPGLLVGVVSDSH